MKNEQTPRIRLRRHHDDEYYDAASVRGPNNEELLRISLQPRFKTSGLSGDEWRHHADFWLPDFARSFHGFRDALQYSPAFVWKHARGLLERGPVTVTVLRKNMCVWKDALGTFADASLGLLWHLTVAGENGATRHLTDTEERERCQQPGCSSPPKRLYRLKRYQISRSERHMADFEYAFEPRHIWFCDRHAHRGDCGLEDCDKNYEVVGGGNPESAPVEEQDVRPSGFAGMIESGEEDL